MQLPRSGFVRRCMKPRRNAATMRGIYWRAAGDPGPRPELGQGRLSKEIILDALVLAWQMTDPGSWAHARRQSRTVRPLLWIGASAPAASNIWKAWL